MIVDNNESRNAEEINRYPTRANLRLQAITNKNKKWSPTEKESDRN